MRIVFIADALDIQYAGVHVYTREIIRAVTSLDKKNEYILIRPESKNQFEGIEEVIVPLSDKIPMHRGMRQYGAIPSAARKLNPDIVIEPGHFGPFFLPKKVKRVTVIHDITPVIMPDYHIFMSRLFHKLFLPGILKRANHIITNSEYTKSDVVTHYPFTKDKTTAILLGKNEAFQPDHQMAFLDKYNIKKPYLLYVGTLEPRKNLSRLISAFERLIENGVCNHQLVLAGKKGWKIDDLYTQIENSPAKNNIVLPGFVDKEDLAALYTNADVFVYPSYYEGFGLPILEAMSCGVPVVTSNTSSLPEVGGDAALYFDPMSIDDIYNRLAELLTDENLLLEMRRKGLERAKIFSWEKAGLETIALLERIGAGSTGFSPL